MTALEREILIASIEPVFAAPGRERYSIYLYGSRAAGGARPDSDYDFAVASSGPLPSGEVAELREELADVLPGAPGVDCVDLARIPLTLAAQVLESGIVLIEGDANTRAALETRLMSMYAMLNEERREILEDIARRGSVYAR
jgi:uncharacterized protein